MHLSSNGAALSCVDRHSNLNHKIGGPRHRPARHRGRSAHPPGLSHRGPAAVMSTPEPARGRPCELPVCHPHLCRRRRHRDVPGFHPAGVERRPARPGRFHRRGEQGGHNVKPEYVWFDGTSYVYNTDETIQPDANGIYHMARANGAPFDGNLDCAHQATLRGHAAARKRKMVPPAIVWMFMTGRFDVAIQKGMAEQGMTGSYSLVQADAEMLITHGVDPKQPRLRASRSRQHRPHGRWRRYAAPDRTRLPHPAQGGALLHALP